MKAINLFSFTRVPTEYATQYLNMLSAREQKAEVKSHEFETVRALVDMLMSAGVTAPLLDGFFFSYHIQHIGKEFDLLKVMPEKKVLNIELKSEPIEDDGIEKQLRQNRYYLGPLGEEIDSFTFVSLTGELYRLEGDACRLAEPQELIDVLYGFPEFLGEGLEKAFAPRKFLISPINTPEQFLGGKYFLTQQQQEIKERMVDELTKEGRGRKLFGITGSAGTGKTLLLYDLADTMAKQGKRCCIIHSGQLCEGHGYLSDHWVNVDILPAKRLEDEKCLTEYEFFFVDEAHRIDQWAADQILGYVSEKQLVAIFSYDFDQWLSHAEKERDIPAYLRSVQGFQEIALSKKIRTSVEIASFYRNMLNLRNGARGNVNYTDIDVLYAGSWEEGRELLSFYTDTLGYTYPGVYDTQHMIGQEFDKVIIVMDQNFFYDKEGRIRGRELPGNDMSFYQLLYQDVSRAREKLCVLIVENYELFHQMAEIKFQMLEKYQYKMNAVYLTLSPKTINRLVKAVKSSALDLGEADAETASDNVDIIVDELFGPEIRKKIVRNSLKYLERMGNAHPETEHFQEALLQLKRYIREVIS